MRVDAYAAELSGYYVTQREHALSIRNERLLGQTLIIAVEITAKQSHVCAPFSLMLLRLILLAPPLSPCHAFS